MAKKKLSEIQKRFIKEYPKDLNASAAARRAGYSKKNTNKQASRIIKKPQVQEAIRSELDEYLSKVGATAERMMLECSRIALSNIADAYDENGQLLNIKEMPEDLQRALSSIETYKDFTEGVEIGETKKIHLHAKLQALQMFWKYYDLVKPTKIEHSGNLTIEDLVSGSMDDDGETEPSE